MANLVNKVLTRANVAVQPVYDLHLHPGDIVETFWKNSHQLAVVTEESPVNLSTFKAVNSSGYARPKSKFFIRNHFSGFLSPSDLAAVDLSNQSSTGSAFSRGNGLNNSVRQAAKNGSFDTKSLLQKPSSSRPKENEAGSFYTILSSLSDYASRERAEIESTLEEFVQKFRGFPFPVHAYQICERKFGPKFSLGEYYAVLVAMTENGFAFVKDSMRNVNSGFYLRDHQSQALLWQVDRLIQDRDIVGKFKKNLKSGKVALGSSDESDAFIRVLSHYGFSNNENLNWSPFEPYAKFLFAGVRMIDTSEDVSNELRNMGLIPATFNPCAFQSSLMLETSDKVLSKSKELVREIKQGKMRDDLESIREDFHHPVLTIDSEHTSEVDDGLSVEFQGDQTVYHVHIADPTTFIKAGSEIDLSARYKATSIYLPEKVYPMIDYSLATPLGIEPLVAPLAVTFSFKSNSQGEFLDFWMRPTRLHNVTRISYKQSEKVLNSGVQPDPISSILHALEQQSQRMFQRRLREGLMGFQLPEWEVRIMDGRVMFDKSSTEIVRSSSLVAEFMVACGRIAARMALERKVPVPFRCQDRSGQLGIADEEILRNQKSVSVVDLLRLARRMKPAYNLHESGLHWAMNINEYCKVTSPLRRYTDIIAHRQLKAAYFGQPTYRQFDEAELANLLPLLNDLEHRASRLQKSTARFWTLKMLEQLPSMTRIEAQVISVDTVESRAEVYLPEFNMVTGLKTSSPLEESQQIRCVVSSVNPYRNKIELEIVYS